MATPCHDGRCGACGRMWTLDAPRVAAFAPRRAKAGAAETNGNPDGTRHLIPRLLRVMIEPLDIHALHLLLAAPVHPVPAGRSAGASPRPLRHGGGVEEVSRYVGWRQRGRKRCVSIAVQLSLLMGIL